MYTNAIIQRETAQIGHDRWLTASLISVLIHVKVQSERPCAVSERKKNSQNNVTFLLIITKECSNYQNKAYDLKNTDIVTPKMAILI